MNVLDVPVQQGPEVSDNASATSSSLNLPFTLNPEDKFMTPKLPMSPSGSTKTRKNRATTSLESSVSKISRWARSLLDSSRILPIAYSNHPPGRPCQTATLQKSAWSDIGSSQRRPQTAGIITSVYGGSSLESNISRASTDSRSTVASIEDQQIGVSENSVEDSKYSKEQAVKLRKKLFIESTPFSKIGGSLKNSPIEEQFEFVTEAVDTDLQPQHDPVPCPKLNEVTTVSSSNRTSVFSILSDSVTAFTSHASPQHSQPLTPSMSEFGDFLLNAFHLEPAASENLNSEATSAPPPGFHDYNLPAEQHASTITLRPVEPNSSLKDLQNHPTLSPKESKVMVESWNDGGQPQQSSLQELIDDLGYLRSLIA